MATDSETRGTTKLVIVRGGVLIIEGTGVPPKWIQIWRGNKNAIVLFFNNTKHNIRQGVLVAIVDLQY